MATRRSASAAGKGDEQLFRGSSSPDKTASNAMEVDTEESTATEMTISMPTTIEGDDVNLTPVIDDSNDLMEDSQPFKTGEGTKSTDSFSDSNLLASLPVYYSTSLPSTSRLQIFQYPTYPRGQPLPIPDSAKARGLREAIRYRPKAKRVEVELPLDLRPAVYDLDKGQEMQKGAHAGGDIGQGGPPVRIKKEVKKEYGSEQGSNQQGGSAKRLEKTRLESGLIPHQTQYMVGVIRDKALHLTPVDSIVQLRPSMHYLDALDAMAQQEKRKAAAEPGEETDEGSMNEDGGRSSSAAKAKEKKKAQNLSVSIRADQGGGPLGARGKGGVTDSRDQLMLADREAEGERWVDLEWKDEKSDESKKTFDAQLFASSKTLLECKTRPREFLNITI